jgi:murein DD-endopeptidase MepM/ murein hydrolase activator NlpD
MQEILTPNLSLPPGRLLAQGSEAAKFRTMGSEAKTPAALKKVASEFESMFVSYLMKVMRETIEESGLTEGGMGKDIYNDMLDQEISKGIAERGSLGIADMLIRRLSAEAAQEESAPASRVEPEKSSPKAQSAPNLTSHSLPEAEDVPDFQMPVQLPVISSRYGMRRDPFTRQPRFHKGVDIAAPVGTEVRAALGGDVTFAGFKPGYGNTVIVRHGDGLETRYAHLNTIDVKKGDSIDSERVLGSVGNTGHSTGPHLHFEVLRSGEQIDPMVALAD